MNFKKTCLHPLNISVKSALKLDLKNYILSNPHQKNKKYIENAGGWWIFNKFEVLDREWIDRFEYLTSSTIDSAQVFYRCAGLNRQRAHMDATNDQIPISGAFNWVLDSDPISKMIWYEPWWDAENWDESVSVVTGDIPIPEKYLPDADNMVDSHIDPTSLQILDIRSISYENIDLCRVNIPHVITMGDQDRWCVSLRVDYNKSPRLWSEWCLRLEHLFL